jgi:hypothetical protein
MSANPRVAALRGAVLIEFTPASAPQLVMEALRSVARVSGAGDALSAYAALSDGRISAYLAGLSDSLNIRDLRRLGDVRLLGVAQGPVEISRLSSRLAIAGASASAAAPYRYAVRTDVEPGGEAELESWYDTEHMPSLAAVPGAVLAQHMLCLDASPTYLAIYDLTSPAVLESGPWLDVRATEWSTRVRQTFRHTRRNLSRLIESVSL